MRNEILFYPSSDVFSEKIVLLKYSFSIYFQINIIINLSQKLFLNALLKSSSESFRS